MPRRSSSLTQVVDGAIDREINSKYDDVKIVADNIDDVIIVANATTTTAAVAASIGVVTAVGSNIDAVVDVHNNTANIATIIDSFTNIDTVASNIVDVNDVADSIVAVNTVNDSIAEVHAVVNSIATIGVVAGSIAGVNTVANNMADISTISVNIADVSTAVDNIAQINQVAADTVEIHGIVNTVIPNIVEILQADSNAAVATTQAGLAVSARVAAEIAQDVAEGKATEASLSAVAADAYADLAAVSEGVASIKAGEASTSATAAHNSELAAAAILDAFDDIYLGAYADNPLVDNDGNPLISGALYFNTVAHSLRVYDVGMTEWIALVGASFADMQDVLLTSVSTGDVLEWNGTKWINTAPKTTITGNAGTATKLQTPRAIQVSGAVTGTVDFDGSAAINIVTTNTAAPIITLAGDATGSVTLTNLESGTLAVNIVDDSHNHIISNVDGLQTALEAKVDNTEKGAANGIATLDTNGKVVLSQINDSILGQLEYKGVWNFSVMPTATEKGQYWIASVAGSGYEVGDWAVYNGVTFDKVDNTDAVASVAGRTGVVVLTKSDVGLDSVDNTADSTKNVLSATKWTTGRTITIGATGKTIDGSGNVSWSLAEIGAQASGNYQPLDATLTALAGVTTAADKMVYATGADTFTTTTISSFARTVLDDADAAAVRTTIGAQALDADLTAIAALAGTSGLLKKTAADTWTLDTNNYVTSSGVTSVTGTAPIVSSGGTTPALSMPAATASVNGYMTSAYATKLDGVAVNANSYSLPARLGDYCLTIADWNDAVSNGFYMGYNIPNSPSANTWYIGEVIAHNSLWVTQFVHAFTSDNNTASVSYRRDKNNGTWSSWSPTLSTRDELDARYSHPTGDGNLHVPATSTTNNGKFLMAGATAGSLSWGVPTDTNTTYTFATGTTNGTFNVTPSGGSATAVAIYGLGTAAYTASTAYATFNHTHTSLSDNVHYLTQDFCQQANTLVSGGGTITVDASGYVKWTERFIVIASGRHADYSAESGFFDITCPTSGTITGVGGATNKTATASGIPLAAFETLYYILPIGATSASVAANFRVVSYTANVDIPATWIKIAKRHDDTPTYVDFANGVSLKLDESLNSETYDVMNAYKAAILETTRTINTVNFNGSANIVVEPYVEQDLTTNATRYLCFVDSSTAGHQRLNLDTSLTFNPSTDTLGAVNISASGTLTETSDRRLKTNIQPIRNATEKVQQLQGCTFKKHGSDARLTGVIAQDVQKVLPEAIVTDENGYLSVAYGNLVGLLIESIKELKNEINELRGER